MPLPTKQILQFKHFIEHYAPGVVNWKKKLSGKDGNGKPLEFSETDIEVINAGLAKLAADLKKGYVPMVAVPK